MTGTQLKRFFLRRPGLVRLGVVLALFLLWEIAARYWIAPMFLSPPSRVIANLGALFETRNVPSALRTTFWELAVAFAMSVVIGLVVGLAVGLSRFSQRSFMPIILLLYGTPQVTILPLFILYFGIGSASKIAFGVSHGIFPIIVTIAGFGYVDRIFITAARSMGASDVQMFRYVLLPAAFPVILTGLRIGFTVALLSILGSETLASLAGLGHRIVHLAEAMETARMFAYIAFVVVIAAVLNSSVSALERRSKRQQ